MDKTFSFVGADNNSVDVEVAENQMKESHRKDKVSEESVEQHCSNQNDKDVDSDDHEGVEKSVEDVDIGQQCHEEEETAGDCSLEQTSKAALLHVENNSQSVSTELPADVPNNAISIVCAKKGEEAATAAEVENHENDDHQSQNTVNQMNSDDSNANRNNTENTEDETGSQELNEAPNPTVSDESREMLLRNEKAEFAADGTSEFTENPDSRSFEEVDANVSGSNNHSTTEEESDMLGEADNTLPQPVALSESTDITTNDTEDDSAAMDVDANSEVNTHDDKNDNEINTNVNVNEQMIESDNEKFAQQDEAVKIELQTTGDSQKISVEDKVENSEQNINKEVPAYCNNTLNFSTNGLEPKTAKASMEMDVEQPEEETVGSVENVQEPEESDVCLIPDDMENEFTEAEKEQAILAKQNAEKQQEEPQTVTDSNSNSTERETKANIAKAEVKTEAMHPATDDIQFLRRTYNLSQEHESETKADDVAFVEEMQRAGTTAENASTSSKACIVWIVNSRKVCKQCNRECICGFRIKTNSDTATDMEYLCTQKCCDALMAAWPGKYFIRRKKFLLDELPADNDSTKFTYRCLQCQKTKTCKYYFKQEEENFYVCSNDCFNLLNAEEPEKFKLKRHSIRVRNIGATTTNPSSELNRKSTGAGQSQRPVTRTAEEIEAARAERAISFERHCAECLEKINAGNKILIWEIMDFCNEICLGKYQRNIASECQTCQGNILSSALGKYCVRFGCRIRQFCCAPCLNEFKKGLKTCSCCQKDISGPNEGFLAPIGDRDQFKDFCSQSCMRRYDNMTNPKRKQRTDNCQVCNNEKPVRVEIVLDNKEHSFCSNPCFSAFKFVRNIVADQCGMCCKYFERYKSSDYFTIYTERRPKVFCSNICLNVYIVINRYIVNCQWCKVKKYNFDMISTKINNEDVLMCSLNCLNLYGVSLNAFSRTLAKCDHCCTMAAPQYHLTMSDASMRNFCTYQCVMLFQKQFARTPLTLENESQTTSVTAATSQAHKLNKISGPPFPTGLPKRVKLKVSQQAQQPAPPSATVKIAPATTASGKKAAASSIPVMSTVSSLASGEMETMIGDVTVRRNRAIRARKMDSSPPPATALTTSSPSASLTLPALANNNATSTGASQPRGRPRKNPIGDRTKSPSPPKAIAAGNKRANNASEKSTCTQSETKIVIIPPYPTIVRNVQTNCKPQTAECSVQCSPVVSTASVQTDYDYSNKILIPVPVPIYMPVPMHMYSLPFPVPVPIPLPIPVPIFIPTTRNSADGIMKEIQKIQDNMPADPFEAELIMMAEMVAEERHDSNSTSENESQSDRAVHKSEINLSNSPSTSAQADDDQLINNPYGDDVLQIAMQIATDEYDQATQADDMEAAMATNTISTPTQLLNDEKKPSSIVKTESNQAAPLLIDQSRKRTSSISSHSSRKQDKRQRIDMEHEGQMITQLSVQPLMDPNDKPDAYMCLKYTFGINAWKQWVLTKNNEIDKVMNRRRPFKTELLEMTADELNYSLCLFVKEVRKPNGNEYAPDTIYYLVLGIQQYLHVNSRIDNIFTDPYYENFTDCLDEVAQKFSVLYNDSQYIVTRVEEEHLWECKQLGAHSPHVLLCTLMFFNTKHFNLTTVDEHMQLSFSHIMKHWKRNVQNNSKTPATRNVLLRFYPPQTGIETNPRKKRVYEQQENEDNPLRCPVRLYEFYLSKCPESVKTRNDVFYLQPERSCVPDSPVWYSTQPLSKAALQKMLHRVKMVKEINIALLTS